MSGRLTTHVLDTVSGRPAAGVGIELWMLTATGGRDLLKRLTTNADGRTGDPLLEGTAMIVGQYELIFSTGAYWIAKAIPLATPPFLDLIPIRFAIAEPDARYHVPLLCSPWSYATYRGS